MYMGNQEMYCMNLNRQLKRYLCYCLAGEFRVYETLFDGNLDWLFCCRVLSVIYMFRGMFTLCECV